MNYNLKEKIIKLRKKGKTYNEISFLLNCSKSTISYHCKDIVNNDNITKINSTSYLQNIIKTWNEETINIIKNLHNYGILSTEISDILKLNLLATRLLCKRFSNPDFSSLTNYERVKRRRKKIKILAVLYKGGKCEKCGYNKYFECLSFHHLDPSKKEFTISQKTNNKWQTIKKELNKCIMLCTTCHGEIHVEKNNKFPLLVSDFLFNRTT
jgi:hypothetical protein